MLLMYNAKMVMLEKLNPSHCYAAGPLVHEDTGGHGFSDITISISMN